MTAPAVKQQAQRHPHLAFELLKIDAGLQDMKKKVEDSLELELVAMKKRPYWEGCCT